MLGPHVVASSPTTVHHLWRAHRAGREGKAPPGGWGQLGDVIGDTAVYGTAGNAWRGPRSSDISIYACRGRFIDGRQSWPIQQRKSPAFSMQGKGGGLGARLLRGRQGSELCCVAVSIAQRVGADKVPERRARLSNLGGHGKETGGSTSPCRDCQNAQRLAGDCARPDRAVKQLKTVR